MIELKHIVKVFETKNDDIHAVNGVDLTIHDGEIYGIIGYSGAGKSTLVRIVNQLERQSAGDVIIDGRTMQNLSKNGVPKAEREKKAAELIHLVGLDGRENSYPSELSGGQKQRVGIARALANDPKILLSDEATSALDPDTTEQILDLLKQINQKMGITIVMITHQMEVVQQICSRMAVMSEGKVVEEGTVKELFEHPKHEITKRFVQNVNASEDIETLAENLKQKYPDGVLLRLIFTSGTDDPVIADAIRQVSFPVSIVQSDITSTKDGPYGTTYLHLFHAKDEEYNKFVEYLVSKNVKVEVL